MEMIIYRYRLKILPAELFVYLHSMLAQHLTGTKKLSAEVFSTEPSYSDKGSVVDEAGRINQLKVRETLTFQITSQSFLHKACRQESIEFVTTFD